MTAPKIPRHAQRPAPSKAETEASSLEGADAGLERLYGQLRKLLAAARIVEGGG